MDSSRDEKTTEVEKQKAANPADHEPERRELLEHLAKVGAGALALAMGGGALVDCPSLAHF